MTPISLNEHQRRIIGYMLDFIKQYENNEINFSQLVGSLDGSIYAGEFKDEEFIRRWYDCWGPLEEFNAVYGDNVNNNEIDKFVAASKTLLLQALS